VSSRGALFGEAQARFVLSTSNVEAVLASARAHGVPAQQIGVVTNKSRGLRIAMPDRSIISEVSALSEAYHNAIPEIMSRAALASEAEQEPSLVGV